jgi:hypothetical protein
MKVGGMVEKKTNITMWTYFSGHTRVEKTKTYSKKCK